MHRYMLAAALALLTVGCVERTELRTIEPPPPDPPITDEAGRALYYDILERGNTVLSSAVVGYERGADELYEFRPASVCQGPECTELFSLEGVELEFLGTRRGILLGHESVRLDDMHVWVYGGWMVDSFFAIQSNSFLGPENDGLTAVQGYAVGLSPGTNPDLGATMSATWNGFMRGVDIDDWPDRGDVISGDATIVVESDGTGMTADVSFTNVLSRLVVRRPDMTWEGLTVEDGLFAYDADTGDTLTGTFYGAGHGEVGGVFERDRIVGAFGGLRESAAFDKVRRALQVLAGGG